VLTIGKKGGPAVKKHAVLQASLAKKTSVTFALGSFGATCTASTIKAKVTANASRTATLSVTKQSLTGCSISVSGVTLNSITALNLPYVATISSAKGNPVTVAGSKSSEPVSFEAKITVGSGTSAVSATCIYTAAKVTGKASNKGNKVSFSKQSFSLDTTSSSSLCSEAAATATFSATYGPVVDTSAKHSPKVFVS
jgi:hypothetical protein